MKLIASFVEGMTDKDILYMTEIYYAGGSAEKTSAARPCRWHIGRGRTARFMPDREEMQKTSRSPRSPATW